MVAEKIILELKSVSEIISRHEVQTLNYLTATGLKLGIILNFGNNRLQYKRIVK